MYNSDPEHFQKSVRINKDAFDTLFNLVKEGPNKNSIRPSIPVKCRFFSKLNIKYQFLICRDPSPLTAFLQLLFLTAIKSLTALLYAAFPSDLIYLRHCWRFH